MPNCAPFQTAYASLITTAQSYDPVINRLMDEADGLHRLVGVIEGSIAEQQAFIASVTQQVDNLIADRIAEINAELPDLAARILEIVALLAGGMDEIPAEGADQAALLQELSDLEDLIVQLTAERDALVVGDASESFLEPDIDGFREAIGDATVLLGQMQGELEATNGHLVTNEADLQAQIQPQNAAYDDAEALQIRAEEAGCDVLGGTPPAQDPEPEGPEPEPEDDDEDEDEDESEEDEPVDEDEPPDEDQPVEDDDGDDDFEDEP